MISAERKLYFFLIVIVLFVTYHYISSTRSEKSIIAFYNNELSVDSAQLGYLILYLHQHKPCDKFTFNFIKNGKSIYFECDSVPGSINTTIDNNGIEEYLIEKKISSIRYDNGNVTFDYYGMRTKKLENYFLVYKDAMQSIGDKNTVALLRPNWIVVKD